LGKPSNRKRGVGEGTRQQEFRSEAPVKTIGGAKKSGLGGGYPPLENEQNRGGGGHLGQKTGDGERGKGREWRSLSSFGEKNLKTPVAPR